MRRPLRLAGFAAAALGFCLPTIGGTCMIPPPPAPPPRAPLESDAEFAARSALWYGELAEREREKALPGMTADEDRLWSTAQWVVLARIEKIGSTRLRGSEEQYYESPLVTLRPIKWLKGHPSPRRIRVHDLSDDSCAFGGAGDAPEGDVGEVFLLFYRAGSVDPRHILDTLSRGRAVTTRSREAFRTDSHLESSPPRKW